ncbi:MAG: photosystem reaction center subunit [Hyphomicrobiales bacterium]|nr:photosystem reaction center subunit [Hyphomicrobiales bacterium]
MSSSLQGSVTTPSRIESDRVEGLPVFDDSGNRLGKIKRLMIEKRSGLVDCVVIDHHRRFGIGLEEIEIPWKTLWYDTTVGGYRTHPAKPAPPPGMTPAKDRDDIH